MRVAPIDGTTVGAPQTVSAPEDDAVLADAAEGPHGEAVILLRPGAGSAPGAPGLGGLIAITRSGADASFGAPETILAAPAMLAPGAADAADVALDGSSGAALAVWRSIGAPMGWSVRTPLR